MCFKREKNKQLSKLPKDVLLYINKNFNDEDVDIVKSFLEKKYNDLINVGKDQYVRSIVLLLEGKVDNIKKYEFISDPRDIISLADAKSNNRFNFFIDPIE